MEFKELVLKRQSDRKYLNQAVEPEKIQQCLDTARVAPSACNAQPWHFVVVTQPEIKAQVAKATASMGMNKFACEAPVIVVITLEKPNFTSKIGSVLKDKEYTLMDIGIVANQFCLQATELGLGTCMIGWFNEKKMRKVLSIPSSKRIPLIITIGYTDTPHREKSRKQLSEIVSMNKY